LFVSVLESRDVFVGMATRYWLDSPGIEFWWVEIFRPRPDRPWGKLSFLYSGYRVIFGGKEVEAWH